MFTRRGFLGATGAGLLAPRLAWAAETERKFLFVFCYGGWDVTTVLAPLFESAWIDTEDDATVAEIDGLKFADSESRPLTRAFFEEYAAKTAFVHGFEISSITHTRCQRILLTGNGTGRSDDWGSRIAAGTSRSLALPYVVVGGPAYTVDLANQVVRMGTDGQFGELLLGEALSRAATPVELPSETATASVDAFLRADTAAFGAQHAGEDAERFASLQLEALDRQETLRGLGDAVEFTPAVGGVPVRGQLNTAMDALELGLSRCAQVEYLGLFEQTWDTHSDNSRQSDHFEELFEILGESLADMATRPGEGGGSLLDETTVVVFSEMGRTPQYNPSKGKDHWTFTSAMLLGSGIRGGQQIGGYDDTQVGLATDLDTGEAHTSGTALTAAHVGATLLALADMDPGETPPIAALME